MNNIFVFNRVTLQILYQHNKKYLISIIILFVSILLLVEIIIPQFQDYLEVKKQEQILRDKISILKQNLLFLSSLPDSQLDSQLNVTSSALPLERDYVGILGAISSASGNAGVGISDFGFQVGEISTSAAQISVTSLPSVDIGLTITGDQAHVKLFLRTLAQTLPISQVPSVHINSNTAGVTTQFYYRPVAPIKFDESLPIQQFSQKDQKLLSLLTLWQRSVPDVVVSSPTGTSSGQIKL